MYEAIGKQHSESYLSIVATQMSQLHFDSPFGIYKLDYSLV